MGTGDGLGGGKLAEGDLLKSGATGMVLPPLSPGRGNRVRSGAGLVAGPGSDFASSITYCGFLRGAGVGGLLDEDDCAETALVPIREKSTERATKCRRFVKLSIPDGGEASKTVAHFYCVLNRG